MNLQRMPLRNIISSLNESIDLPNGSEVNGIAELVSQEANTLPEIDGKFVGVDDKFPVRIYHRLLNLQAKFRPGTGYGNSTGDVSNTYSIIMVVFLQHGRTNMYPDEFFTRLQSDLPERLKINPYKDIIITISGTSLDSQANWIQEYRSGTDYRLKSDQFLFKINYSIETIFSKGCFKQCP